MSNANLLIREITSPQDVGKLRGASQSGITFDCISNTTGNGAVSFLIGDSLRIGKMYLQSVSETQKSVSTCKVMDVVTKVDPAQSFDKSLFNRKMVVDTIAILVATPKANDNLEGDVSIISLEGFSGVGNKKLDLSRAKLAKSEQGYYYLFTNLGLVMNGSNIIRLSLDEASGAEGSLVQVTLFPTYIEAEKALTINS